MEEQIRNVISQNYSSAEIKLIYTDGGWLVEVVYDFDEDLDTEAMTIENVVGSLGEIVWKTYTYRKHEEKFIQSGTLHVRDRVFDENGISTSFLDGEDCYLDISEYDAEAIVMKVNPGPFLAKISFSESAKKAIMPFRASAQYKFLETMGDYYPIESTNAIGENNIQVTLLQID